VRQFLSKSLAGGLSAGVVLLWWPLLFPDDTLASWLARGVAWTVCVELLLLALGPLEAAIWETRGGERVIRRTREAEARLRSGSRRRTLGRLAAIAVAALAVPGALLAAGLNERAPAKAEARPVKIVEVTRVVRPVRVTRVKRVVAPAPEPAPVIPQASDPAPRSPVTSPLAAPPAAKAPAEAERVPRKRAPAPVKQPAPEAEAPAAPPSEPEDCAGCAKSPPAATGSRA
jgi:hypothetical protein